ncbi:MAG: gamma-glutamyltransferase [Pirellulales bacterium]
MPGPHLSRRSFLTGIAWGLAALPLRPLSLVAAPHSAILPVVGQTSDGRVAFHVPPDGGNCIDAAVATALIATIQAPIQTGIGGYGMSAVVAVDGGRRVIAVDGNSTAPQSMTRDFFQPRGDASVPRRDQEIGWLSAGVPGVLAGLQLLLDRWGTRRFGDLVQPAIGLARDGIRWPGSYNNSIVSRAIFREDPGSRKLYLPQGSPPQNGDLFRNPELADMLDTLAQANSVAAFYRGDIAQRIADAFARQGGLVTTHDLASYRACEAEPLRLTWEDCTIHTAPLTAGGLSVLQALQTLRALQSAAWTDPRDQAVARIESLRLAWRDRLTLLGDPAAVEVPVERLLSAEYAAASAERIIAAVSAGKILEHGLQTRSQAGTIHISAADADGNFIALTLTHGQAFGACVTVDGLGLTLGHGVSRFDPRADHPNSPGPGKRPLHNMVPTIVSRAGRAELAVGGAGGRKIPNSLHEVLRQYVVERQPLAAALAAPRVHTEGPPNLLLSRSWPAGEVEYLQSRGYRISTGAGATMSAVAKEQGRLVPGRG